MVAGAAGVVLAGGLIAPAVAAAPGDRIGTGKIACVPGPGADCRDVVQKWTFTHHGDLSGAKFARAKLHGADLRGARLNKANFRGVVLRHAQLQDAFLAGVNFSPTRSSRPGGRVMRAQAACEPNCQNADLSGANLSNAWVTRANLTDANLNDANLTGANLTGANLTDADLTDANLFYTNLTDANLTNARLGGATLGGATLTGAVFCNTTMPDGSTNNSDCS